jgi:hypothetical protein
MILTGVFSIGFLIYGIVGFINGDLITGFLGVIGCMLFASITLFTYMKYEIRLWKAILIACMAEASAGGIDFNPADVLNNPEALKIYMDAEKESRNIKL